MGNLTFSLSLMCTNYVSLKKEVEKMERLGVDYLHIDVMDGKFVPNFALGTDFIKMMRRMTDIPMDIHLMIENPQHYIDALSIKPGDMVSVHAESTTNIVRLADVIAQKGAKVLIALNPGTSLSVLDYLYERIDGVLIMTVEPGYAGQKLIPETLKKISLVKKQFDIYKKHNAIIEVDGNISLENFDKMIPMGANTFVLGSSGCFINGLFVEEEYSKFAVRG